MTKHIPRVYCSDLSGKSFSVPEFRRSHLISVLRLKEGSKFLAFNKDDGEWLCEISGISKSTIIAQKIELQRKFSNDKRLALAMCIIKSENMKLVIEKGTELGVTDFFLIRSEFTNANCNVEKLKLIAILASEQCERLDLPEIHDEMTLKDFINALPNNFKWFSAIERIDRPTNINLITSSTNVGFIIGPEGGFSEYEKAMLIDQTIPISISTNILRAETAAIVCLGIKNVYSQSLQI